MSAATRKHPGRPPKQGDRTLNVLYLRAGKELLDRIHAEAKRCGMSANLWALVQLDMALDVAEVERDEGA